MNDKPPKTDRALLELAAKAGGIKGVFVDRHPEDGHPAYSCGIGRYDQPVPLWNPLTDDGAALRLAVKLALEIYIDDGTQTVVSPDLRHDWQGGVVESHGDPCAATRRAIVRAAALIGEENK